MSDLPLPLPPDSASILRLALDQERKIERALDSLGPIAGQDVLVLGGGEDELARYEAMGARPRSIEPAGPPWPAVDASTDAVVSVWSGFRGADPAEVAEADRVLRPAGRLLVVHDYGRDDVSRLRGDLAEHGEWTRRDGPFLARGFRIRVIHTFWTFPSIEAAVAFLGEAFGDRGREVGDGLTRPRLTHNVAIYHRSRGGTTAPDPEPTAAAAS